MNEETYQLIAFDMDGTLLTSDKRVLESSRQAIHEAVTAGKHVALCTGRNLSALQPYREALSEITYAVCSSGAMIVDYRAGRPLWNARFDKETVRAIAEAERHEDILLLVMEGGHAIIEPDAIERLEHYHMAQYAPLIGKTSEIMADLRDYLLTGGRAIEKINLFHTDTAARLRTRRRLYGLPVEMADSEETSLELSPVGIHKGSGLARLCELLGVPMEQAIAVGDADNDLGMLRAAGMAIAMGNANENAKRAAGAIVADNDHGGCAEAIRRYLLGARG